MLNDVGRHNLIGEVWQVGPVLWVGILHMIRKQKHAEHQRSSLCFLTVHVASGHNLLLSLP